MAFLFSLLFFISLILFILGLFSPKKSLFWYKQDRTRKLSAIVYGFLIIVFFKLSSSSSLNDGTNSSIATTTSETSPTDKSLSNSTENENTVNSTTSESENEAKTSYKKIGDQVEIGNFSYLVNNASFSKTLGNEYMKKTADGIFLIVNVTFRNNDNKEHTLDNSFFKLTDESGTEFSSSNEGTTSLEMSGKPTLFLKQCNPQITKSGLLVFEVPDKKAYNLHLSGGLWSGKTSVVKLITK